MARTAGKSKAKLSRSRSRPLRAAVASPQRATKAEAIRPVPVSLGIGHPTKALIFELETLAVEQGRKKVFDSAKSALAGAGLSLAPMLFCRLGVESTPSAFLSGAFQALKVRLPSQPRLMKAFDANLLKVLCEKPTLQRGFVDLLAKVRAHGVKLVAISLLDEGVAGSLMAATGLAGMDVRLFHGKGWAVHPYTENIVNRVVDRLGVLPATCVSLVSSGAAAESALCAGTRVVAVPDSFTSFQDFSGVDEVLDTWSLEVVESVLSLDGEGH